MPEAAAQSARPASNRGSAAWVPVDEARWEFQELRMQSLRSQVRPVPSHESAAELSTRAPAGALAGAQAVSQAQRQQQACLDAQSELQAQGQLTALAESQDSRAPMVSIWVWAVVAAGLVWRCFDWLVRGSVYELVVGREADEARRHLPQAVA